MFRGRNSVESVTNRTKAQVHDAKSSTTLTSSRMRRGYTVIVGSCESHDQKPHSNGSCSGFLAEQVPQVAYTVSQACRHKGHRGVLTKTQLTKPIQQMSIPNTRY